MGLISSDIESFLKYLETDKGVAALTRKNYQNYLNRFTDFLMFEDSKNYPRIKDSSELDIYVINRYRYFLSKYTDPETNKPYQKSTQNYFLIAVRQFLNFLKTNQVTALSFKQVKLSKQKRELPQVISLEDFDKLLKTPDMTTLEGLRDRAILMLLFSTGLLVSQISLLNRDDINLKKRHLTWLVKSDRKSFVLSELAVLSLERYLIARPDSFKPLFIRYKGDIISDDDGERMRLTPRSIERMLEKYCKMVRLPLKVTPLVLRHSFAVLTLKNGMALETLQDLLGHSALSSTQVYEKFLKQDKS